MGDSEIGGLNSKTPIAAITVDLSDDQSSTFDSAPAGAQWHALEVTAVGHATRGPSGAEGPSHFLSGTKAYSADLADTRDCACTGERAQMVRQAQA